MAEETLAVVTRQNRIESHVRAILGLLGEDPRREGLRQTPLRVAKAYDELLSGYDRDVGDLFTCFESEGYDELVLVRDVPFVSLCEHHILPFYGRAHVGYIPSDRIAGLSKLARLVDVFARRLQVQERLTVQVADALVEHLRPLGAICVVEAEHSCMAMRGVKKTGSVTVTSAVRGVFKEDAKAREEALSLIGRSKD